MLGLRRRRTGQRRRAASGAGLARLLRPDQHPVVHLLADQPLTVPDVIADLDTEDPLRGHGSRARP